MRFSLVLVRTSIAALLLAGAAAGSAAAQTVGPQAGPAGSAAPPSAKSQAGLVVGSAKQTAGSQTDAAGSAAAQTAESKAGPTTDDPGSSNLPVPPDLPDDLTVWPNKVSYRNSDPWLYQNHEKIRKMRPRVLVLNFANDVDMDAIRQHAEGIIKATAEATRYHGFEDPAAPPFIEYEVAKYVDLRDTTGPKAGTRTISSLFPVKAHGGRGEVLCDYAGFYTEAFAARLGFRDPRDPGRYLNLHELINAGFVHELWFYAVHDPGDRWPARETCEYKQFYDENCGPIAGKHGGAGNGHDRTMPWSGRSFRIAFFNPHRGVGCAMENFGHTLEWMATTGSIGYYRKYFLEFAELNYDTRFGMPFGELYRTDPAVPDSITYPTKTSMVVKIGERKYTIDPYIAVGGSVHFPPGARHHYDLDSPFTVMSTIENYRRRNGPDGHDLAQEFNIQRIAAAGNFAPDCMGNWMVFWRQCMPGLDNPCVDDNGRPMKNWWVFLFY